MTPEQEQAIADLRSRHVAPKQIARQLGLRPAEVTAFLKAQAEQATTSRLAAGELPPIFQCLVNKSCLPTLTGTALPPAAETADEITAQTDDMDPSNGFAIVTVSRQVGFNRIELGTYLVDIWCLGVKDAVELRTVDPTRYRDFVDYAYAKFPDGYTEISLEMAQAIVFGAEQYAAELGFQPHRDFAKTRSHLGTWSGEPQLHFGRDGKPFYRSGPYDNPAKILKTLQETVGEGNFDYLVGNDDPW
jgi:hypothetical protein